MSACNEIIDDIEDLISSQDITPKERYANKKNVTVRAKRKIKNISAANDTKDDPSKLNDIIDNVVDQQCQQSIIPGTQRIYVKTWGCAHNNSDSEYMAGQLAAYGYNLTSDKHSADLWLLNSCTVKNPSEDTFRNEIQLAIDTGKYVVVAGCVPQGAPKSEYLKGLSVVGVQQIDRVVEVVEETLKGHTVRLLQPKKRENGKRLAGAPLALPKIRKNPLIEIIAINSGCLNQCTYCKTKHSRGDLVSYPPEEIIARAQQAFGEGLCEIWLTSEDTGTYGRDIGTSLPELLWKLIEVIPDGCMLRLGMTNPPYILEHLEEIGKIMNIPSVYGFLHVPVQSGSDEVLSDMKREYNCQEFEVIVNELRDRVPGMTVATDIICGFPTETEQNFEETMKLCDKYKFPSLFINQFFPRPGTPAARMERIPGNVVKQRTKRLTDLFNSYEPYANRIGKCYRNVLVTEISHDKKYYVGHNKFYEQILLPMTDNLLGKSVQVEIIESTKFSMLGKIIDKSECDWKQCSNVIQSDTFLTSCNKQQQQQQKSEMNGHVKNESLQTPQCNNSIGQLILFYSTIGIVLGIIFRFLYKFEIF